MLDGDIAAVDFEAGRIGPPPSWLKVVLASKWFGSDPWSLIAQDEWEFWTEAGMLMREVEADAHRKAGKNG